MLYLGGYRRRQPQLPDALVWGHAIRPGVLLNKDGALQSTLAYRGPDLDSATFPQLVQMTANLNNVLRRSGIGWTFFVEDARTETHDYPEAVWPHPVPALIDEERRDIFTQGLHFEDEYYLTLVYQTPTTRQAWLKRMLYENLPESDDIGFYDTVDYFEEQVAQTRGYLHDLFPAVAPLNDDETWTYLHSCVSTKRHRVQAPDPPLYADVTVADQPFTGGMRPMLGSADTRQYLRTATLIGFPAESFPCMLAQLSQLPVAYRLVWRLLPYGTEQARKENERVQSRWLKKRKKWKDYLADTMRGSESAVADPYAEEQAAEAQQAVMLATSEEVRYGQTTMTITVMDPDPQRAGEKLTLCERVINNQGFLTIREDLGAVGAWFSSHPGNVYANVRRPILHSLHWARMWPGITAMWAGPKWDSPQGARNIVQATSAGATPFRENLYVGDVGDVFIVGPKGCHAPGTPILMYYGSTKVIEAIRVGDQVMGPDSTPRTVLRLHQGTDEMARLTSKRNAPFEVNMDHILALKRTNDGGGLAGTVTTLSVREWLTKSKTFQHIHELYRVGVDFPAREPLPLHPYILGVLLGDGCLTQYTPVITTNDVAIREKIAALLEGTETMVSQVRFNSAGAQTFGLVRRDGRSGKGPACANPLKRVLQGLGLWGTMSGTKFIPQCYKVSSREDRLWLLAGLIDTDGTRHRHRLTKCAPGDHSLCYEGRTLSLTSKSQQLTEDVAFVARSLGFICRLRSMTKTSQTGTRGTYYGVTLGGGVEAIPSQVPRKQVQPHVARDPRLIRQRVFTRRLHDLRGFQVEPIGRGAYYGFECDGDHLYLMGDFTVTHNSGKSFWLATHAVQFLRRRHEDEPLPNVHFLDKDFAARVITSAVGGQQYILGDEDSMVFQPLADIDEDQERFWAMEWLTGLFAHERVTLDAYESEVVFSALRALARMPRHQRTMTGLSAFVQNQRLRDVLLKYTVEHPGGLLDADHDTYDQGFWWWYELSTLMRMPSILPPVLTCLFHKIQRRLTGAPTVIIIDEGWIALNHEVLAKQVVEWLKTLRKLNACVWFATQSLMDSEHASVIGDVIFQECATKIYLPNPAAHSPKVQRWYADWGLNERQIDLIASMIPKRQYYLHNVLGSRCYELEAGPIQQALLGEAHAEERPLLLKLLEQYPTTFAVHWLREHRGLDWAATELEQVLCASPLLLAS